MKVDMEVRVIKMCVGPKDAPIYDERATMIEIVDEAAGEFLVVSQCCDNILMGAIQIDPTEWNVVKKTIDEMIKKCREYE